MISHGKDLKIFTGNANPALAQEICKLIGIKLGEAEVKSFADGEASVSLYETVRGSDVFLINSTCKPVNDSLMELLIMIDACKRASAGRVTAVIPYFGYARQDRKAKSRDPISAKLVANMITASGADRVLTMDLHASQIQGFFDTAGSICNAAKAIVEVGGAKSVYACASHGVLSGPALERLNASVIKEVALLNTIPESMGTGCDKIKYLSVAPMFAEAIERIYQEISIAKLFN